MLAMPVQGVVSSGSESNEYHRSLRSLMSHLAPDKVPEVERDVASFLQLRQAALDAIKAGPTDLGLQAFLRYNFHMADLGKIDIHFTSSFHQSIINLNRYTYSWNTPYLTSLQYPD